MNLLAETKCALDNYFKDPEDVTFIGSLTSGHQCTWEEFEKLADFEYDDGYGVQVVAPDLVIIFKDNTRLVRTGHSGRERWKYINLLPPAKSKQPIFRLKSDEKDAGCYSLEEINPPK